MLAAGKTFVKTYLKVIIEYAIFLSNRQGKFKLLGLLGAPPSLVPSLSGTSWSPHEENPEGGWSAYCNDSLSKQKIYSM